MKKLNLIKKTGCCSDVNINEDDIDMDFFEDIIDSKLLDATGNVICLRTGCEFAGKALSLDCKYDYVLGEDSSDYPILVPLKKK